MRDRRQRQDLEGWTLRKIAPAPPVPKPTRPPRRLRTPRPAAAQPPRPLWDLQKGSAVYRRRDTRAIEQARLP